MIRVDAIQNKTSLDYLPLDWVGMGGISSFVRMENRESHFPVKIHAFVNLISESRGIHMSRIYNELQEFSQKQLFSFSSLEELTSKLLKSQGAISDAVKLEFEMQIPIKQKTLKSEQVYQKDYPLKLQYLKIPAGDFITISFSIDYSSTCPQSAALSHEALMVDLNSQEWASAQELLSYIKNRGLVATPHAQRSVLKLDVTWKIEFLKDKSQFLKFVQEMILNLEAVLGTPTQGVVKRVDEQEFAILNAQNLMFCEDAARKVKAFLKQQAGLFSFKGSVTHIESLHSHDAIAEFSSSTKV